MSLSNFQNRFFIDVNEQTGEPRIKNRAAFREFVSQFKGKRLIMELAVFDESKRSLAQNAYYFGVVIPHQIAAHKELHGLVLSKSQIHEFNKANFFCVEIFNAATGMTIKLPTSTTLYTTKEFNTRLEAIRQYYEVNFDWIIPEPQHDVDL